MKKIKEGSWKLITLQHTKERGIFLVLRNWFLSTTANKVHVWTPRSATPQESRAGYQLLNAAIFNVLVRCFCQGILRVENTPCGVTLKPKQGSWPARSWALLSTVTERVTFLQRGARAGTELETEPRSPTLRVSSGKILFSGGFDGLQCCWQLQWP